MVFSMCRLNDGFVSDRIEGLSRVDGHEDVGVCRGLEPIIEEGVLQREGAVLGPQMREEASLGGVKQMSCFHCVREPGEHHPFRKLHIVRVREIGRMLLRRFEGFSGFTYLNTEYRYDGCT